ncbi:MAG: inositol monophosphatase [Proteobacteria bacterium]|jgi:myo-inositol-1(or 4)-monophosphatase|nr:inositol monophosphatase [Pseudomonadota bacterium]
MEPMATIALRAAREASLHISRSFDRPDLVKVSEKGHNDYVTNIDRDAERIIVEILRKMYPGHTITGEEAINDQIREDAEYQWIIDPIDGTLNFLRQVPHFCVAIACLHKGKLAHGVIVDPMRNEEFVASRGKGCQLNGHRVRVSSKDDLDGALIATGGPAPDPTAQGRMLTRMLEEQVKLRQPGSACLELAYVAAGRMDGLWMHNLKPWDMAAGALMITEAGGLIGDFDGGAGYMRSGNVVAGNPKCFKTLAPMVRKLL